MRPVLALAAVLFAAAFATADVRVGDRLPAMRLPDRDGAPVALDGFAGRVVIVDFWATWCLPCRTALPALDALARTHGSAGLTVVAVSVDRDAAAARRFADALLPGSPVVVLFDERGDAMARCGAPGMPTTLVADREGIVRGLHVGWDATQAAALERRLGALLAPPVAPPTPSPPATM